MNDFSSRLVVTGWSSVTTKTLFYLRDSYKVFCCVCIEGVSNSKIVQFNLPYKPSVLPCYVNMPLKCVNAGIIEGPALLEIGPTASNANVTRNWNRYGWTPSGLKAVIGNFWYFVD